MAEEEGRSRQGAEAAEHPQPEEVVEVLRCPGVAVEEHLRPEAEVVEGRHHQAAEAEEERLLLGEAEEEHHLVAEEEHHQVAEEEHHQLEAAEVHRPEVAEEAMAFRLVVVEVEECQPGEIFPREARCWRRSGRAGPLPRYC